MIYSIKQDGYLKTILKGKYWLNELFSPIVKHIFNRVLLVIWIFKLKLKAAFVYHDLEEKIYVTQFDGFNNVGMKNR